MAGAGKSLEELQQKVELAERQLAEIQGVLAVLLAIQAANCIDRNSPSQLIELRERIVSSLLASPLREQAVGGAEAAVATFLGAIQLVRDSRAAAATHASAKERGEQGGEQ